jgi:uncharacterized membrane protein
MSTKSYSSFVVVLEWDWDCRTNLLITKPAPGGEPLWSVSGHSCNLRLNTTPAETCEKSGSRERLRALPHAGLFAGAAC